VSSGELTHRGLECAVLCRTVDFVNFHMTAEKAELPEEVLTAYKPSADRELNADFSSQVLGWTGNVSCCGLARSLSKRSMVTWSGYSRSPVLCV
jgi:hypothetical protein